MRTKVIGILFLVLIAIVVVGELINTGSRVESKISQYQIEKALTDSLGTIITGMEIAVQTNADVPTWNYLLARTNSLYMVAEEYKVDPKILDVIRKAKKLAEGHIAWQKLHVKFTASTKPRLPCLTSA